MQQSSQIDPQKLVSEPLNQILKEQHRQQIGKRARKLDVAMSGLAAVGFTLGRGPTKTGANQGLMEIGTVTFFVMRQVRGYHRGAPPIVFAGYKAKVVNGDTIELTRDGNVVAHDFRPCPIDNPTKGSIVMSARKTDMFSLALRMDQAIHDASMSADPEAIQSAVRWPAFWCGFLPEQMPEIDDCPASRRLALQYVRDGWVLPSMMAYGGKITHLEEDKEGILIGWDGVEGPDGAPERVQTLPGCAVLRPFVRVGVHVEANTALGDFMPKRFYPHWSAVVAAAGQTNADCLLAETVLTSDEIHHGLRCRRVEFCQRDINASERIFEDVRHLVTESGETQIQVVSGRSLAVLTTEQLEGRIKVDLSKVREEWEYKFK